MYRALARVTKRPSGTCEFIQLHNAQLYTIKFNTAYRDAIKTTPLSLRTLASIALQHYQSRVRKGISGFQAAQRTDIIKATDNNLAFIGMSNQITGRCWIAYMDIYGFAAHVEKHGEPRIYSRLLQTMESVRDTVESHNLHSVHLSDSLFVVSFEGGMHGAKYLTALRDCIADVQDDLLNAKFIPRGCLAHGTIEMSPKVIVGAALIRAVRLEQQIAMPCVLLPLKELSGAQPPSDFVYDVPTKRGGLIRGAPILPRTLQPLKVAHQEQMDDCLIHGPPDAALALKHLEDLIYGYEKHQANHRPIIRRPSKESKPRVASQ
jgi:hypothetical protein